MGSWFCDRLHFLGLCVTAFTWQPRELSRWLKKWPFSRSLAIWTAHVLEKLKVLLYCFWVPQEINSCFCSKTQWQMFLMVSCSVGDTIIISLNLKLGGRGSLPSLFSQILDFIHWTVWFLFWSILNGVTLKTGNSKLLTLTLTLTLIRSPLYLYFSDKFRVALKWRGKLFALAVMPTLHVAYMHFRTTY